MSEARRREDELRELATAFGLRRVPRPRPWFRTRRGRIRAAAWTALGALFVMLLAGTLLFAVSGTTGLIVSLPAAAVMLLAIGAIYVEVFLISAPGAEEDENERAVAGMVSGKGIDPPR
ncbi:MAG: hypothetical protein AB7O78_12930 [Thermoleophilia bacterium]